MKKFLLASRLFILAAFCAWLPQLQAAFVVSVATSPSTVQVGGTVIYSITISNTISVNLPVQVISQFPTDATVVSAVNNYSSQVSTNPGQVVFTIASFPSLVPANFTLQLQPGSGTSFANVITVESSTDSSLTVSTNIVVEITLPSADLGISTTGLPSTVVVGDFFNYALTVTNAGPADATGVNIESGLSSTNLSFVSVSPAIPSSSLTGLLMPGTLTNGQTATYNVTLQARLPGDFTLLSTISSAITSGSSQTEDPDTTDNSVTSSIHIIGLVTNTVAIVSASPMVFNYQNALLEQVVIVSNLTSSVIDSVRVMATSLVAPNRLFNATGTNSGHPYVVIANRLAAGGTAAVNLQFFVTNRTAIDPGLLAAEGPSLITIPTPTGTFIPVDSIIQIRNGSFSSILLQFPTTVGRKYSLVYAPTVDGTNRIALFAPFVANTTRGQFIDSGPQVTGDGDRFYSVIEQP